MEDMKLWHATKHGRISTGRYRQSWEGNILRRKHIFENETQIQLRGDKKGETLSKSLHHYVKEDQQTEL